MGKVLLLLAIVAVFLNTGNCKPASANDALDYPTDEELNDDNENYYDDLTGKDGTASPSDEEDDEDETYIAVLSQNATLYHYENDNITLPCETNATEPVRLWLKGQSVYFQSTVSLQKPPKFKLGENNSLKIPNFKKEDEGVYQCKVMIGKTQPSIFYTIHYVSDEPEIVKLVSKDTTSLRVGDSLVLTCLATGRPKPHISWHKGSERFAAEGETLTISHVRPRDAGIYRCLADNKKSKPAHGEIEIKIEHKPVVTIEKITVNSESNYDTELKCIVHAEPSPVVVWKKDGRNIIQTNHIQLKNEGHNHLLILKGLQESDFGEYTCSATNSLGSTNKHVKLVKTPAVLKFIKPPSNNMDLVLIWEVQSKSPIVQHEIQYRKKGADGKWEVIVPEVTNAAEDDIYTVKYTLKGLEPGNYETRIRSENQHGWSEFSDPATFEKALHGHGKHKHKMHHKEEAISQPMPDVPAEHHHVQETDIRTEEKPMTQNEIGETVPEVPSEQHFDDTRAGAASSQNTSGVTPLSSSVVSLLSIAIFFLCIRP